MQVWSQSPTMGNPVMGGRMLKKKRPTMKAVKRVKKKVRRPRNANPVLDRCSVGASVREKAGLKRIGRIVKLAGGRVTVAWNSGRRIKYQAGILWRKINPLVAPHLNPTRVVRLPVATPGTAARNAWRLRVLAAERRRALDRLYAAPSEHRRSGDATLHKGAAKREELFRRGYDSRSRPRVAKQEVIILKPGRGSKSARLRALAAERKVAALLLRADNRGEKRGPKNPIPAMQGRGVSSIYGSPLKLRQIVTPQGKPSS